MKAGILFPLSSFPSDYGIGDLGKNAYSIIDELADNGGQYLQILPFHPSTQANSPYRCISTYAGDEIYIDLEKLVELGLLASVPKFNVECKMVHYDQIRDFKHKYLLEAYKKFRGHNDYETFLKECPWVFDFAVYCTFAAINQSYDWSSWSPEFKFFPKFHQVDLKTYHNEIGYYQFVQYIFYSQWFTFKQYANKKGISIIGDMPFYVDHGSVEVWLDNASFLLDEEGHPTDVAGVPPDYFSATGQYWGNPIYNWEHLKNNEFKFWIDRIGWACNIFDITRIDHFRAFDSYWDIPASSTTAIDGTWKYAPGYELFDCLYEKLGAVKLVAEDLGYLRSEVIALKNHYHLKGMKVFQFMLDDGFDEIDNSYFYPGTHDNETIKGWTAGLDPQTREQITETVGTKYPLNIAILNYCLHSKASDVIIPIWDLLEVNNDQRFNVPGEVNEVNWTYRIPDFLTVKQGIELFGKLRKEEENEL